MERGSVIRSGAGSGIGGAFRDRSLMRFPPRRAPRASSSSASSCRRVRSCSRAWRRPSPLPAARGRPAGEPRDIVATVGCVDLPGRRQPEFGRATDAAGYRINRGVQPRTGATTAATRAPDLANGSSGGRVRAAAHGVVARVQKDDRGGYGVHVARPPPRRWPARLPVYAHLARGSVQVHEGSIVSRATRSRRVGQTGRASTPTCTSRSASRRTRACAGRTARAATPSVRGRAPADPARSIGLGTSYPSGAELGLDPRLAACSRTRRSTPSCCDGSSQTS